jgi:hypothetical protein
MNLLQNQKTAIVIMVVMILVSIPIGAQRSLAALEQKALDVFVLGESGDGIGIQSDLEERMDIAYNLVTVGRKYLSEKDPFIQNVLVHIDELRQAQGPSAKYQANAILNQAVTDLYQKLIQMDLSEVDRTYPRRLFDSFNSRNDTISHDPYNLYAAKYNQALKAFPANILSKLVFAKPLELFQ